MKELLNINEWGPEAILWAVFGVVVLAYVLIDLVFLHRQSKRISFKSASIQSAIWVALALGFAGLIWIFDEGIRHASAPDESPTLQFLMAYVTEYMLSVDNIFVFIMIFRHFALKEEFHHKVLYYGVFGAVFFRAIFIGLGHLVVDSAIGEYVLWFFGAILIYTGFKMLMAKGDEDFEPDKSPVYRFMQKNFRMVHLADSDRFFAWIDRKFHFTTMFLIVVIVETTDIIFAVDSIPAVFSITQNTFVVYTSNIFAIMGLRAMFFMLEGVIDKFWALQSGVSFILMFIGAKMLLKMLEHFEILHAHVPDWLSFTIIMVVLAGAIVTSLAFPKDEEEEEESEGEEAGEGK